MVTARRQRKLTKKEKEILHRAWLALRGYCDPKLVADLNLLPPDAVPHAALAGLRGVKDQLDDLRHIAPDPASGYRTGAELRRDVLRLQRAGLL